MTGSWFEPLQCKPSPIANDRLARRLLMRSTMRVHHLASLLTFAAPAAAHANPTEIALAAYARHVEDMNSGDTGDINRTGDALEAKIGVRAANPITLGLYADLGGFDHDSRFPAMLQVGVGAFVDVHFLPHDGVDPWLELAAATGYERLRAQVGLDSHTSASFAASPVFGVAYSNNTAEPEWLLSVGVLVRFRPR